MRAPLAEPAERGRLDISPVVLRKIVERAADGVPGTESAAYSTILRSTAGLMSSPPRSAGSASVLIDRARARATS